MELLLLQKPRDRSLNKRLNTWKDRMTFVSYHEINYAIMYIANVFSLFFKAAITD